MATTSESIVLRVAVFRDESIVQERRLRSVKEITVGRSKKNSLVLKGEWAPESFKLIFQEGQRYYLRFSPAMKGKVSIGGEIIELSSLKESTKAEKRGDVYVVPLALNDRGKIEIGEETILFQLIKPAPSPAKETLLAAQSIGRTYLTRFGEALLPKTVQGPRDQVGEKKVLRVAVVKDDHIIEEKLLRKPSDVTIGKDSKCTLFLPVQTDLKSYRLFIYKNGKYSLRFTSNMEGMIKVGEEVKNLKELINDKKTQKQDEYYIYPIDEQNMGRIVIQGVRLLFQFMVPPRPVAQEELWPAAGKLASLIEKIRVWASVISTGKQSGGVVAGLRLGVFGCVIVIIACLVLPWIEEFTVDFSDKGLFFGYGWWSGQATLVCSVISLIFGLVGLLTYRKKLLAIFGIFFTVLVLVFLVISPFIIRDYIKSEIEAQRLIPLTRLSMDFGFFVAFVGNATMAIGFLWAIVARPIFSATDTILRIALYWRDTKIKELLFPEKRDISVGVTPKTDFVVPISGQKPLRLFRVDRHGEWWLALPEKADGELVVDNEKGKLEDFASKKGAKVGGVNYVQVKGGDSGILRFSQASLRFDFVHPPKTVVGRQRPLAMDAMIVSSFIASMFLVGCFYTISMFAWNPAGHITEKKVERRQMKVEMNLVEEKDVQRLSIGEGEENKGEDEGKGRFSDEGKDIQEEDKPKHKGPVKQLSPEEMRAQALAAARKASILGLLDGGGAGRAGGPLSGLIGGGGGWDITASNMVVVTDGAGGGGVYAAGYGGGGGRGGMMGTPGGSVARLSGKDLRGSGKIAVGPVASGERTETAVKIQIRGELSEGRGTGEVDKKLVEETFRRRKSAIEGCYQIALKTNPSVAGKIVVTFTIGTAGTITNISVTENTTGDSSLAACIVGRIRGWAFPPAKGGEVTFRYPFLLQSGG